MGDAVARKEQTQHTQAAADAVLLRVTIAVGNITVPSLGSFYSTSGFFLHLSVGPFLHDPASVPLGFVPAALVVCTNA